MKKSFLLFIISLMLYHSKAQAQDLIYKKDNTILKTVLVEIGTEDIKYREYGNQSGAVQSIKKSEVEKIWAAGKHVIFDIDVQGGLNLKHQFKDRALAVFVMPPSIKILEERLQLRQTDSPESIALRVEKAEKELQTAKLFDCFILNEDLNKACIEAEKLVNEFLKK